jgi:hypothetical protein
MLEGGMWVLRSSASAPADAHALAKGALGALAAARIIPSDPRLGLQRCRGVVDVFSIHVLGLGHKGRAAVAAASISLFEPEELDLLV